MYVRITFKGEYSPRLKSESKIRPAYREMDDVFQGKAVGVNKNVDVKNKNMLEKLFKRCDYFIVIVEYDIPYFNAFQHHLFP